MIKKIKKLSLISRLMILMLSLSSLYAFEIPFLNNNGKTEVILATNEADVKYSEFGGFSGSYKLFSLSNANNGFQVDFEIQDTIFVSSNTFIMTAGFFSNKALTDKMSKYEDGDWTVFSELVNIMVDIYIGNKKITKQGLFSVRFFDLLNEKIFNNKMRFEDGFGNKLTYELPDKYKDIIYKKIMIYQRKKEQVKKEYEEKRAKENEAWNNWLDNYNKDIEKLNESLKGN